MRYRPDVDGLRAVAVLSVILFHIDKGLLPGGFVGVDIFFVISGFLITGNIAREIEEGRFSIVEFYRRRVKRIAPMMLLIICVTLLGSQLLMRPEDARSVAESAAGSLLSVANVYFWLFQDTGYFAADSAEIPLLHLWSLGLEEQFYIVWPLMLLALYRPGRDRQFTILSVLAALASFLLGAQLLVRAPSFAYYMLPTRAGELLIGAVAAILAMHDAHRRVLPWMANLMAACGVALLAASLSLLNERQPFPGWLALPPTLGAGLLLLSGRCGEKRISGFLSLAPLVWVGLISYSAYLWHWPLLAFFRYGYGRVSVEAGGAILLLTLLLAWISYRCVEQPARRSEAPARRIFATHYIVPAGMMLVVCMLAIYPGRFGITLGLQEYRHRLAELRRETQPAYMSPSVCQRVRLQLEDTVDSRCVLGLQASEPPRAVLWGDSNAAHYVGMLEVFAREAGFRFRNLEASECPPVFGNLHPFVAPRRDADCRASTRLMESHLKSYDVVIVSAAWTRYQLRSDQFLRRFFHTVEELVRSNRRVIIIGKAAPIPGYDRLCPEKALRFPFLSCSRAAVEIPPNVLVINETLRRFAEANPGVEYFDANSYLCPEGKCWPFTERGEAKYFDANHLTLAASTTLGKEIVAARGVPTVFAAIARTKGHAAP